MCYYYHKFLFGSGGSTMYKRIIYLMALLSLGGSLFLFSGCSTDNTGIGSTHENKAEESTAQETTSNKSKNQLQTDNASENSSIQAVIKTDRNLDIWSNEEHDAAEKIANEFLNALKNRDMSTIANHISYPIGIPATDGTTITFYNKEQLSSMPFDKLFDEKFVNAITNTKEIFTNWRGFMLGEGANIVLLQPKNGNILIYSINTDHAAPTEEQLNPTK